MNLLLHILSIIGIVLLVIAILILLILLIPIFYNADVGTNNKSTFVNMKVNTILNIVTLEILNDLILLRIFEFIKIKLKSNEKDYNQKQIENKNEIIETIEISEADYVPEDISFFRKIKLKAYIAERKAKEKIFKFRKTVNTINEYSYKMELLKKTIQFIEKIINQIKPKESKLSIEMGCGCADLTGKLVGMLSIMQVKYTNLVLIPNFEKSTLNIDLTANGHIMPMKLLITAIKFYNEDAVKELRQLKKKGTK